MLAEQARVGGRFIARERGAFERESESEFRQPIKHHGFPLGERLNAASRAALAAITERLGLELKAA